MSDKKELSPEELEQAREEYRKKESAGYAAIKYHERFFDGSARGSCTATGFADLDKALDGGLYAGLYIIGAISSLGKTTFALQIGDQIARRGQDVLIISLEMARDELISKSISRLTFEEAMLADGDMDLARTTRDIMTGEKARHYSDKQQEAILNAFTEYMGWGQRIYIREGIGDIGAAAIRNAVARHIKLTGNKPAVIIDYVQILASPDSHLTDKQATDKNVMELKRISRDFDIPVIGISSFNRDSYYEPVGLSSFKESGAIEYSSDVLIGMQYDGMDYIKGEKAADRLVRIRELKDKNELDAKDGRPIEIQVKILKNRNGVRDNIVMHFHTRYNVFREHEKRYAPKEHQASRNGWTTRGA